MNCKATTREGLECMGTAKASGFCAFHDPANAKVMAKGRSKGGEVATGKSKSVSDLAPDLELETACDVKSIIKDTINKVRKGHLDPKFATAIGYLCNVALGAIKQATGKDEKDNPTERPLRSVSAEAILEALHRAAPREH